MGDQRRPMRGPPFPHSDPGVTGRMRKRNSVWRERSRRVRAAIPLREHERTRSDGGCRADRASEYAELQIEFDGQSWHNVRYRSNGSTRNHAQ